VSGQHLVDRAEEYRREEVAAALAKERDLYVEAAARQLETLARLERRQHEQRNSPDMRHRGGGIVVDESYIPKPQAPADAGAGTVMQQSQRYVPPEPVRASPTSMTHFHLPISSLSSREGDEGAPTTLLPFASSSHYLTSSSSHPFYNPSVLSGLTSGVATAGPLSHGTMSAATMSAAAASAAPLGTGGGGEDGLSTELRRMLSNLDPDVSVATNHSLPLGALHEDTVSSSAAVANSIGNGAVGSAIADSVTAAPSRQQPSRERQQQQQHNYNYSNNDDEDEDGSYQAMGHPIV